MAYTPPVVSYSATLNGTYTTLTGVQSVQIGRGRKRFQDDFTGAQAVIELIPATSYTTPLAIGQYIDVRTSNLSSAFAWFTGRITDIERIYEMPYNSGTGYAPADRIVITATTALGVLGQSGNLDLTDTQDILDLVYATTFLYDVGYEISLPGSPGVNTLGLSSTIDSDNREAVLKILNNLVRGGQLFVDDVDLHRALYGGTYNFRISTYQPPATGYGEISFIDGSTSDTGYKYTGLKYLSGAEMSFTEVQVNGYDTSLAPQIATQGNPPHNSVTYDTQLNSTSSMANLASYVLTVNNETAPTPYVLNTSTEVAPLILDFFFVVDSVGLALKAFPLAQVVKLVFRGSTVRALLQGFNLNFYDDRANVEMYLSPFLGIPFTLDSTTLGVLDTNRLGYP